MLYATLKAERARAAPSTVYVFRDRIANIDPANAAPEEGAEVIDGTGHTLLPGLVDRP